MFAAKSLAKLEFYDSSSKLFLCFIYYLTVMPLLLMVLLYESTFLKLGYYKLYWCRNVFLDTKIGV